MTAPFDVLRDAVTTLTSASAELGSSMATGADVKPELLSPVLEAQQNLVNALDGAADQVARWTAEGQSVSPQDAELYRKSTQIFAGIYLSHKMQAMSGSEGESRPFARLFSEVQKDYVKS